MELTTSTRPVPESEPTLVRYQYFWPADSSSKTHQTILSDNIVIPSSRNSSQQSQTLARESQIFVGGRRLRKGVDEIELFDDDHEDDDWLDVASKRQLTSKAVRRSKSTNSTSSSNRGRTLQLVMKKKQKQVTMEGFMR